MAEDSFEKARKAFFGVDDNTEAEHISSRVPQTSKRSTAAPRLGQIDHPWPASRVPGKG